MVKALLNYFSGNKSQRQPQRAFFALCLLTTAIFCISAATNTAKATTYYVDANRPNDDGNGLSLATAWKTIPYTWSAARGGNKVAEGDTVLFRNGSYGKFRETDEDDIERHFHRTNWIIYKADTGCTPILTSIYIDNADHHSDPLYQPGESYLWFEGFNIQNGLAGKRTNYLTIKNCNLTCAAEPYSGLYEPYYLQDSSPIWIAPVNHLTIEDCNIHGGFDGMFIYGQNLMISNNIIHRYAAVGIHFANSGVLLAEDVNVIGNHIYDQSKFWTAGDFYGTVTGSFTVGEEIIQATSGIHGIFKSLVSSTHITAYQTTVGDPAQYNGEFDQIHTITGQSSGATISNFTGAKIDYAHSDGISIPGSGKNHIWEDNIVEAGTLVLKLYAGAVGSIDNITIRNNLLRGHDTAIDCKGVT
jgi:hypothetical protein